MGEPKNKTPQTEEHRPRRERYFEGVGGEGATAPITANAEAFKAYVSSVIVSRPLARVFFEVSRSPVRLRELRSASSVARFVSQSFRAKV